MIDSEERRNGISPAYAGTNAGMGLTKRELFAAMAMQAYAMDQIPEKAASLAVQYADALLAELAKEKKE